LAGFIIAINAERRDQSKGQGSDLARALYWPDENGVSVSLLFRRVFSYDGRLSPAVNWPAKRIAQSDQNLVLIFAGGRRRWVISASL
jgi:hypothetical protein